MLLVSCSLRCLVSPAVASAASDASCRALKAARRGGERKGGHKSPGVNEPTSERAGGFGSRMGAAPPPRGTFCPGPVLCTASSTAVLANGDPAGGSCWGSSQLFVADSAAVGIFSLWGTAEVSVTTPKGRHCLSGPLAGL